MCDEGEYINEKFEESQVAGLMEKLFPEEREGITELQTGIVSSAANKSAYVGWSVMLRNANK